MYCEANVLGICGWLSAGVQVQRVVCVSSYTGLIASDRHCAAEGIPKPDDAVRSCNADCQIRLLFYWIIQL